MVENLDPKNPAVSLAETWIQQFIAIYGHGAITRYIKRRLNGVSLVRVIQALELGTVTSARKVGEGAIDCTIEYLEEGTVVTVALQVNIYFVPPELVINLAEEKEESDSGTDHAA